jgi:DNA-binding NtrC family response regulator
MLQSSHHPLALVDDILDLSKIEAGHVALAAADFDLERLVSSLAPLRERVQDIPLLAEYFLAHFAAEMRRPAPKLTAAALARLSSYAFPGNIRELENIVERALILSATQPIGTCTCAWTRASRASPRWPAWQRSSHRRRAPTATSAPRPACSASIAAGSIAAAIGANLGHHQRLR